MTIHNTSSTYYQECNSTIGSTTAVDGTHPVNTVFHKTRLATVPSTTIIVSAPPGAGATITITSTSSGQGRHHLCKRGRPDPERQIQRTKQFNLHFTGCQQYRSRNQRVHDVQ